MNITHHDEASPKKQRLNPLLTIACLLTLTIGCATNKPVVVATWRGDVLGEKQLNERVELGEPKLSAVDWENDSADLQLRIEQSRALSFDIEKKYQRIQAIREQNVNHQPGRGALEDVSLVILTAGLYPAGRIIGESRNMGDLDSKEGSAIASLKAGTNEVEVVENMYFADGGATSVTREYLREVIGSETELIPSHSDVRQIPGSGLTIKVESGGSSQNFWTNVTDEAGVVVFSLAQTLSDALRLEPVELSISGQWHGRWMQLGTTKLTDERIAQIVERATERSIAATGTPLLPPFGRISVKTPEGEVNAGSECDISLAVRNTGKGEFFRLVATGESATPALDGVKMEFGKLGPNETLTVMKRVQIPKEQSTGPVIVTFNWSELNGYQPDPVQARIMVRGLPRPRFATSVQVIDDNSGNSVGNGDGRIQKGEAVDLLVTVKNIGDGVAKDVKVSMDGISEEGVIVNVPEAIIGEIPAGETKQTRLTVTTKKTAKVDKLIPTIHVLDQYLNVNHDEPLVLALDSELPPSIMVYKSTVYVGKEEIAVQSGAGNDTSVIARAKPGTSLDATGELGQWLRVELPKIGVGWVHRSGVQFEPPSPTEVASATPSMGVIEILQKAPPLIAVSKPLNDAKVAVSHVEVSGVIVDNQAVSRAEFKLNGQPVQIEGQRGIGVEAKTTGLGREYPFAFTADLAVGQNQIEITAWNADGLKTEKTLSVVYEKDKGSIYLVCIGIDKYQDQSIPHLKYAVADARSVAECFEQHLGVPAANTYLFTDEEATLQNIKDVLGVKVRQRAGKNDTVIIYFSGHGAPEADPHSPDQDGVAKYLLPVNAERDSLFSTALAMEEVRTIFRRLISDRVIFIADSCYSGAAGGRTLMPTGTEFRSINQDNLLARLRDTGIGRVIMTASRGSEVSQEKDELGHGVFTYYLLKGLQGEADKNHAGVVTVTELYEYVSAQVPQATQNTQTPLMSADEVAGEIVMGVVK